MSKSTRSKKSSSTSTAALNAKAVTAHKFTVKKKFGAVDTIGAYEEHGGVRALVCKAVARAKGGATPAQVAAVVAKARKGYKPSAALNCLRWLQSKGYVARMH